MIKEMIRKTILLLTVLWSISALAIPGDRGFVHDVRTYAKAEITDIQIKKIKNKQGIELAETWVILKVMDGEFKGQTRKAIFGGETDLPEEMQYRKGDRVFIGISQTIGEGSTGHISIYDVDNSKGIIVLAVTMLLAILFVGRFKGLASLVALIVTILLLFFVLIPATMKGYSPLPITIGIAIVSIIITLPIIAGLKLKTVAAILGGTGGIIFSALLAMLAGKFMHLSGIVTNDMLTVFYASTVKIDIRGLVMSGMVIAALGAIMDICISIASSTTEIYNANPNIDERRAFSSVLNIGTDILGSMVNTLILAYVGSSLSLILFISMRIEPEMSLWMVLNYNPVLSEIVKSVVGSIGLFASIPLTAFISITMHKRFHRASHASDNKE